MAKLRTKCEPPDGLKEKWCESLKSVLMPEANERRAGTAVYTGMRFVTRQLLVFGVAARRSAKSTPIWFKYCPYCGERIDWNVPSVPKGVHVQAKADHKRRGETG